MIALPAVPKLTKLIPLLASDKDGEVVVAAARAIGRTLEAVKADFHDLARALSAPPEPSSEPDSNLPFIVRCLHQHPALTEWEAKFLASIVALQARGRRLSDKQRAVIFKTWDRLQ